MTVHSSGLPGEESRRGAMPADLLSVVGQGVADCFAGASLADAETAELLTALAGARAGIAWSGAHLVARATALMPAASRLDDASLLQDLVRLQNRLSDPDARARASAEADLERLEHAVLRAFAAQLAIARSRSILRVSVLARRLRPEQLEHLLAATWATEQATGLAALQTAADALQGVERDLDAIELALRGELEAALARGGAGVSPEIVQRARAALAAGTPARLVEALDGFGDTQKEDEQSGLRLQVATAAERLVASCQRLRTSLPPDDGDAGQGQIGQLLRDALSVAERFGHEAAAAPAPMPGTLAALTEWETSLERLFASALAVLAREPIERQGAVSRLLEAISATEQRLQPLSEGERRPVAERLARARQLLDTSTELSGAIGAALQAQREAEAARGARVVAGAADLRESAARLTGFLQKMADKIPAGPLSQARIALAQADGVARSGEIDTIAALSAELQALLKRFNALAQVGTKQALGREQAERKLVAAEAAALGEAAGPPFAARAAALAAAVEEGKLEMDAARARLAALRGQAERVIRLDALRAKGRRTSAAAGPVGSAVGALEQALAGRDLAGIRRSAQALREALGWRAWLNRPAVRFGVPALLVLLIVAGLALRPRGAAVTHSVVLQFEPRPAAAAEIVLASASGAAERRTVEQGAESLEVDLRPGRYDVFVDGGFTGIAVVVPGASPVTVPARR